MKTRVYFIRHGTTDNNIGGRFQGKSDIPLGEKGLRQAACLGERFADVPLDAVFTSPLKRAYQTAEGVCAHKELTPVCCDDLREIDGGLLEGRTNDENVRDYPDVMHAFRSNPSRFVAPEGESAKQVHERVTTAMWKLIRENAGSSIAIVSHGFALMCSVVCLGTPFDELKPQILANASVSCFVFEEDGSYAVEIYNDQSHLPEEVRFYSPFWKENTVEEKH